MKEITNISIEKIEKDGNLPDGKTGFEIIHIYLNGNPSIRWRNFFDISFDILKTTYTRPFKHFFENNLLVYIVRKSKSDIKSIEKDVKELIEWTNQRDY